MTAKNVNNFFAYEYPKNAKFTQIPWNNWKQMHMEKLVAENFSKLVLEKSANSKFLNLFCLLLFN